MELSLARTRADLTRLPPGFRCFDVGIPEWPCPALPRAGIVNPARPLLSVKKNAVAIGKLHQRFSILDLPDKQLLKLGNIRFSQDASNRHNVLPGNPDKSRRPGTAVSTLNSTCRILKVVSSLLVEIRSKLSGWSN